MPPIVPRVPVLRLLWLMTSRSLPPRSTDGQLKASARQLEFKVFVSRKFSSKFSKVSFNRYVKYVYQV
jgi:hypothetical protein